MTHLSVLLFHNFETLDVFGPVEIFGRLKDLYHVAFYSLEGGLITNDHNVTIDTLPLEELEFGTDIFLIPGGYGTRHEVDNEELISQIKSICEKSNYVHTVCTGTALLARTGLLNGLKATSNKKAFQWVMTQGPEVLWQPKARWVVDGKYYTSSGVSAGMDMALGFLSEIHGVDFARQVAYTIEYRWNEDKDQDDFWIQE
jgi:putative intracellular protease/amidase